MGGEEGEEEGEQWVQASERIQRSEEPVSGIGCVRW